MQWKFYNIVLKIYIDVIKNTDKFKVLKEVVVSDGSGGSGGGGVGGVGSGAGGGSRSVNGGDGSCDTDGGGGSGDIDGGGGSGDINGSGGGKISGVTFISFSSFQSRKAIQTWITFQTI